MLLPLPENLWNRYTAAHLLNRAGFGGTPAEIDALSSRGPASAVTSFLKANEDGDLFPVPTLALPAERMDYQERHKAAKSEEERREIRKAMAKSDHDAIRDLRLWWLNRMRYTSAPLLEKTTLFWHGHFATSIQKVNDPFLMWQQNETIRTHALGKFPDLLKAMSRDPATIRWLDLNQSKKNHPNENFAREVMELFSLGEGNYTEKDIQEAARAFTGYRVNPETGAFRRNERDFDPGPKTVFGQTGPFSGDDIIDIIVARPQCARFIGRKIWKYFVAENPSEESIRQVADLLLRNGYDIGATLGVIFRSSGFYSAKVMHHQIKGPVQWLIQTTRMLEVPLPDPKIVENSLQALGQVLFAPPNVKGWDGGRAWISSSSLLYRYNLATFLLTGKGQAVGGGHPSVAAVPFQKIAPTDQRPEVPTLLGSLVFRVFNAKISAREYSGYREFLDKYPVPCSDTTLRDLLQVMMGTPSFQLD